MFRNLRCWLIWFLANGETVILNCTLSVEKMNGSWHVASKSPPLVLRGCNFVRFQRTYPNGYDSYGIEIK